jgi:tetratricopeptide (TPR) repeat protein
VALLDQGRLEESFKAVTRALELAPENSRARTLLAHHLFLKRDFPSARNEAEKALRRSPGNLRAALILGKSLLFLGEPEKAASLYEQLSEHFPKDNEIRFNLALAYRSMGKNREASRNLEQILSENPDFTPALTALTSILVSEQQFDRAVRRVDQQIHASPENPDYRLLMAHLLSEYANAPEKALAHLNKARQFSRAGPRLYQMTADILVRSGKIDAAIAEYRELTAKEPDSAEAHMALGALLDEKGEHGAAKAAYSRALEIRPDFAAAANNLAWLMANEKNPDLGEALRLAMLAKRNAPADPFIADTLGWVHYQRGAYSLAISQFTAATGKLPDMPSLRYHLALALHADGRAAEARRQLEQCLETEKSFPAKSEARQLLMRLRRGEV